MKTLRPFIALLALAMWLLAGVHVMIEHGNTGLSELSYATHHHNGEPDGPADDDHDHDLGAVVADAFAKPSGLCFTLLPSTVGDHLTIWTTSIRERDRATAAWVGGNSPPDSRARGWLFVVQTALPVRGPSLDV